MPITNNITRRNLTKGGVWAFPVVVASSQVPVYAASTKKAPDLYPAAFVSYNATWQSGGATTDSSTTYKIYTYRRDGNNIIPGESSMCVLNTVSGQIIRNYVVTLYLSYDGLTFTPGPYGASGWTTLTRDITKERKVVRATGRIYYPYTAVFTGSFIAVDGTTCLPGFSFVSQSGKGRSIDYYAYNSVEVDGEIIEGEYGPISIAFK